MEESGMKVLKRMPLMAIIAALLIAAFFTGCATGARPVAREAGRAYELILLHTNDHHGTVLPNPNTGRGGLAERATFIKSVRAANQNVLLLDAGDMNTGTALSNMFTAEPDIRAYNIMGYDAMTFGNHEFNSGQARLDKQMELAEYPFVSSNVRTANGGFLGGHQYLVKNYEGFRVGIFGITTLRTLAISNPDRGLTFVPEIEAAKAAVDLLRNREKVDIVIGLVHMGDLKEDSDHITSLELAHAVSGIDILVDGHAHSFFPTAKIVGDTWIVTANERGNYVGQGRLTIVDGVFVRFDWSPVQINTNDNKVYAPDAEVAAMLAPFISRADASLKEVVGNATDTFIFGNRLTRFQETSLGNMITDANVWYFKEVFNQDVDFAFHNGGNIRAELPRGPLTRENILTVLPFENLLYIVSLRGSELTELFDFIATIPQGAGGFPQFSKEVRYTRDIPNNRISGLTIGGAPVDPNKVYRFATNDFLLTGGDGYTVLTKAQNPFNTSLLLSYVVIEYIAAQGGSITPSTDGRLTVIGGVTP